MSRPFPWRPGMRAIDKDGKPWRIYQGAGGLCAQGEPAGYCGDWEGIAPLLEAKPDSADGGTRGAFLEEIRKDWNDPTVQPSYSAEWKSWYAHRQGSVMGTGVRGDPDRFSLGAFPDEWSVLMAAWNKRPGWRATS